MARVAVIGAGSWGTAVAWLLGDKGHEVTLWAHTASTAQAINETGSNPRYLTDIKLENVTATSDIAQCVEGAEAVLVVVPSSNVREIAASMAPHLGVDTPVAVLSKGVEADTGKLMTDILEDEIGNPARIAALSGPNHAEEVSRGLPAASVVACLDEDCAEYLQELCNTSRFRVYTSNDVIGVELCAACKNIIAIGCGIIGELGYGDNTQATVITRGLAEMSRLVVACGGQALTCMGLAGMGDLIATCTSKHSRNRTLGTMIAHGQTLEDFVAATHMVAEGAIATVTVTDLARKQGVELPIAEAMRSILSGDLAVETAINALLARDLKPELFGLE